MATWGSSRPASTFLSGSPPSPSPSPDPHNADPMPRSHRQAAGMLAVHFEDESRVVLPINPHATTTDVIEAVKKKRLYLDITECGLFIQGSMANGSEFLRPLNSSDLPFQIQQESGGESLKFIFRDLTSGRTDPETSDDDDSETEMFRPQSHFSFSRQDQRPMGFLDKRGRKNRAWRRRWFVLDNDRLYYYKKQEFFEQQKPPHGFIELNNPPAVIRTVIDAEAARERKKYYYFEIVTPKRVFQLRAENHKSMVIWMRVLKRFDETNATLDALDTLVSETEHKLAELDENRLQEFSTVDACLANNEATDALLRHLSKTHREELIYFWLDSKRFISNFHISDGVVRQRFAQEIYDKYIQEEAERELIVIKKNHRQDIQRRIQYFDITRDMFDDIRVLVHHYLDRDIFGHFYNSVDFMELVIKYRRSVEEEWEWPQEYFDNVVDQLRQDIALSIAEPIPNGAMRATSPTRPNHAASPASSLSPSSSSLIGWGFLTGRRPGRRKLTSQSIFENAPGAATVSSMPRSHSAHTGRSFMRGDPSSMPVASSVTYSGNSFSP